MTAPQDQGVYGQERFGTRNTAFNELSFMVTQMLNRMNVATLVRVDAVHITGRVAAVGTVDVTPLVNQTDGQGKGFPFTTIYGLPYIRVQGGANAVICDPQVGDIGMCVFCDHDLTRVKASGKASNPGSRRRFDMSDGVYLGGWNLSVAPTRYLVIDDAGITIMAGTQPADLTASKFTIHGDFEVTGTMTTKNINATGTITATVDVTGNGTSLHTHVHPVTSAPGTTGVPT